MSQLDIRAAPGTWWAEARVLLQALGCTGTPHPREVAKPFSPGVRLRILLQPVPNPCHPVAQQARPCQFSGDFIRGWRFPADASWWL